MLDEEPDRDLRRDHILKVAFDRGIRRNIGIGLLAKANGYLNTSKKMRNRDCVPDRWTN